MVAMSVWLKKWMSRAAQRFNDEGELERRRKQQGDTPVTRRS